MSQESLPPLRNSLLHRLEREREDCEAQLLHARRLQERIKSKLQKRLLTLSLEHRAIQSDLEERVAQALAEIELLSAQLDSSRRELALVYTSRSWRWMAPLRRLKVMVSTWRR